MGLFEKQIPKYVRTPEEEVAVEPVVVDDIFDPLFNAEVKQRLADTYGNSPLATLEGYGELLGNIWQGNDSDFGKGMGLLSAFGRSMEKADDLVLGAATEIVEGLSGQGFDNPIKNIFVNDEDYTGRRFLAAAANTMRGFADGATVTEEDFGPEWGLPSLGIELISDVGILGGGLARSFAPELAQQAGKRVSSSEIFRNLGKSGNAKTTIGEVGQLMSDYDDLMTRAAIDITAPGLRPAFKALLPRLKQFVGFTGSEDFVDVTMPMQSSPPTNLGDGSDGAFELHKNAYQVYKEIPETVEEQVERISRTASQIAEETIAEAEMREFNEIVEDVLEQQSATVPAPASQVSNPSTQVYKKGKKAIRYTKRARNAFLERTKSSFEKSGAAVTNFIKSEGTAINEVLKRAGEKGFPITELGIDTHNPDGVSDRFAKLFRPGGEYVPIKEGQATKKVWAQTPPDFSELTAEQKQFVDEVRQTLSEVLGLTDSPLSDDLTQPLLSVHTSYLNDLRDVLSDDSKLAQAIYTGEWAPEDVGVSALINAFLNDPKRRNDLFYRTSSTKWYVSPSERAVLNVPEVREGLSAAYSAVDNVRFLSNEATQKPLYTTQKEFAEFWNSDEMTTALYDLMSKKVESMERFATTNTDDLVDGKIAKFKRLLKQVMFPKAKPGKETLTTHYFYTNLQDLVEYVDQNIDTMRFSEDVMRAVPDAVSYIIYVTNTIDDVGTHFIAPTKGLGAIGRDARLAQRFGDTTLVDDFSPNYDFALKAIVGQLGKYDVPYEDLAYIMEPLRDYVQFGFKHGVNLKGTDAARVVDRWYSDVLPLLEEAMVHGFNPFNAKFKPEELTWDKYNTLVSYLGITKHSSKKEIVYDPDSTFFNDILNDVLLNSEHSYAPKSIDLADLPKDASPLQILERLQSSSDEHLRHWGFKAERPLPIEVDYIEEPARVEPARKRVTEEKVEFDHYELDVTALSQKGKTFWKKLLESAPSEQDALHKLQQATFPKWDREHRRYIKNPYVKMDKWGRPKTAVVSKYRRKPIAFEDVPETVISAKYGVRSASPIALPFLTPRSPSEFITDSESTKSRILAQERQVLSENPLWKSDILREYDEAYKHLLNIQTQYGYSDSEVSNLLAKINDENLRRTLSKKELEFLQVYTSEYVKTIQNLPYRSVSLRTGDYYNTFADDIRRQHPGYEDEFDFELYELVTENDTKRNLIFEMIDSAETDAAELLKHMFDRREIPGPSIVSESAKQFVKENLIDKLGQDYRKFAKYWNPTDTDVFNFDLPRVSTPEYIRIGENVPMYPEYLQILSRYNMPMSQVITGARETPLLDYKGAEVGRYLGALDYPKMFLPDLQGFPARQSLEEIVAKRQFQMTYFDDKKFEPVGAPAIYAELNKTRYRTAKQGSAGSAPVITEQVEQIIESQPVEEVIEQFIEPAQTSLQEAAVQATVNEICPTVVKYLESGIPEKQVGQILDGTDEWRWYRQIMHAANVRSINASGDYATGRLQSFTDLAQRIGNVSSKIEYKNLKRFYLLKEKQMGDILLGDQFWDEFISTGMFSTAYKKGSPKIEDLRIAMQHNADTINNILKGNFVEVVVHDISGQDPNTVAVTMRWISSKKNPNSDLIRRIANNKDALARAKYEPLLFSPPETLSEAEIEFLSNPELMELSRLEAEAQTMVQEHYKRLGFTFDPSSSYTRHALNKNPDVAFFLEENFYKQVHSDTLDDICDQLSTLYDTRRAFGSRSVGRRFRGHYWDSERKVLPIFSYDPTVRFKSAITGGALANSQYQAFTDFFLSDTFKIKGTFNTIEDLKKVLYAEDPNGTLGNLTNAELVTFKVDAMGRVTGLTKFDKMSDKGLQAALNDPNTILVPASAITSLDKMFRREKRMSNKLWVFLNKHFTIPFKMGVLMNPGFLLGNISDASMKMATTMAKKYGTSMTHEAEEAARSMRTVVELKNTYYQAFDQFLESAEAAGFKVPVKESIPDIVAMNPKARKAFIDWMSGNLTVSEKIGNTVVKSPVECTLTSRQLEAVNTWIVLQEMQMSTSRLREFEDVAGLSKPSKFEKPNNMLGRVIEGKGNYDRRLKGWRTWGFFVNNPVVDGMMGASEGIEDLVRTATIVDDLRHRGYSDERMFSIMKSGTPEERLGLEVALENAKNAMYSAQFDYERLTDFLDTLGTAVPFPIFFLKNFVYWMDLFQNNPQFVDNMIDIQEGLWAHRKEEDEDDEFAKAAKGRGAIPVGGGVALPEWFKGIYKPSPLQSMFGAFSLLNDPLGDMQYRLHPAISGATAWAHDEVPTDLTTLLRGSEELSYRPYSTNMYERNIKESDPNFNATEYAMHRINPFERTVNTYLRTPEKIKKGEAQLSDFVPSVFQPDF